MQVEHRALINSPVINSCVCVSVCVVMTHHGRIRPCERTTRFQLRTKHPSPEGRNNRDAFQRWFSSLDENMTDFCASRML